MPNSTSFLGKGWSFPPTFVRESNTQDDMSSVLGSVVMVSDEDDINEGLEVLFNTAIGERVMQPRYGADLQSQVFQPMNASSITIIEDLLKVAIVYHETRIDVEKLSVTPDQVAGKILIEIDYLIRGTNSRFNFVYPFYLNETGQQP